jgi:hypothetical protein
MSQKEYIQLKQQLKIQLTENTGEVLQQLTLIFQNDTESHNEVIVLTNNYNRLLRERRLDLISYETLNREVSKINNSLLQLIDTITEKEAQAFEVQNAIFQRILVISLNEDRKAFFETLLPDQFYKEVDYQYYNRIPADLDINYYQLIIFDAKPIDKMGVESKEYKKYSSLYLEYLENAKPYLLYFGRAKLPDSNSHGKEKAYFANSVFSIHSRIQEMIAYLKYSLHNTG